MKIIQVTQQAKDDLLAKFKQFLDSERFGTDNVRFNAPIADLVTPDVVKPTLIFTPEAYLKIETLIMRSDKEIAWHGIVTKQENNYIVSDIMVYPQTVSTASVVTDNEKYAQWIMQQPDEIFFNLRLQGHSHVNMSVNPSNTDDMMYDNILKTLPDNAWYVFMIINKKAELFVLVYDFEQNVIFETRDVTVKVLCQDNTPLADWSNNQFKNVEQPKSYTTPTYSATETDWENSYRNPNSRVYSASPYDRLYSKNYLEDDDVIEEMHKANLSAFNKKADKKGKKK